MEINNEHFTRTIALNKQECDAIKELSAHPKIASLMLSRRALIRYLILNCKKIIENDTTVERELKIMRETIIEIRNIIDEDSVSHHDLLAVLSGKAIEKHKRIPKSLMTDEELTSLGAGICANLGGTTDGDDCRYMKYAITPSGRKVEFEDVIPLKALKKSHVEEQYSPSKEGYLNATSV